MPCEKIGDKEDQGGSYQNAASGCLDVAELQNHLTVEQALQNFIELYAKKKNKDWRKVDARLRNTFIKEYGHLYLTNLNRKDIIALLDKIMAKNTPIQANRTHAAISKFLKWCAERDYIETSPALYISKPAKENPRDRVLNDDEIKGVWRSADKLGYPFGPLIQILMLTGQRRGEVTGMRWSEINFKENVWIIPKERSKNGKSHSVPLTHAARLILEALPRFLHSDFVFTTTGITPVSGLGKIKDKIAKSINKKDWTIHDLRRTAASGMARLKVPPHVVEKILNHTSGTFSSVAGVYIRIK